MLNTRKLLTIPCGAEWANDLTREMDKHLLDGWKRNVERGYGYPTYIMKHDRRKNGMAIRFPGATRGHIEVDNDLVIQRIVLYHDTCFGIVGCYDKSLVGALDKYIGYQIVYQEDEVNG